MPKIKHRRQTRIKLQESATVFSGISNELRTICRVCIENPAQRKEILCGYRSKNWKFGKTKINILMLGIIYKNNAIPLYWEMLDKGGLSDTHERKQLLEKAIKTLGKERIHALLADREFIGVKWFKYLMDEEIESHIRIPKQIKKGSSLEKNRKTINNIFRYLPEMGKLDYPKEVNIFGYRLLVSGMKSKNG